MAKTAAVTSATLTPLYSCPFWSQDIAVPYSECEWREGKEKHLHFTVSELSSKSWRQLTIFRLTSSASGIVQCANKVEHLFKRWSECYVKVENLDNLLTNNPNCLCRSCCSTLLLLLLHFYGSSVMMYFGLSFSFSELFLGLSPLKTSIIISPDAPTCHESAVIETLIIPHKKTTHGRKTERARERDRQGPISISAAAWLSGAPGGPRDLIWRRLWELKSYLGSFIGGERSRRRMVSTYYSCTEYLHLPIIVVITNPVQSQLTARIYWFSNYCMHLSAVFLSLRLKFVYKTYSWQKFQPSATITKIQQNTKTYSLQWSACCSQPR